METTKQIDITKRLNLSDFTVNNIEQVRNYIRNRESSSVRHLEHFNLKPQIELEIERHALDRWNERVGPVIQDLNSLTETIKSLHGFGRVRLYDKQKIGTIDDDILFTFKYGNRGKVYITTFYGRVSLVHYLSNFDVLRKYNRRSGDNVALSHSIEVLNSQSFVTHKQIMFFNGEQHKYVLEVFDVGGLDVVYISTLSGYKGGSCIEVQPNNVDLNVRLNSSCLTALKEAGYGDFVSNYINSVRTVYAHSTLNPVREVTLGA